MQIDKQAFRQRLNTLIEIHGQDLSETLDQEVGHIYRDCSFADIPKGAARMVLDASNTHRDYVETLNVAFRIAVALSDEEVDPLPTQFDTSVYFDITAYAFELLE